RETAPRRTDSRGARGPLATSPSRKRSERRCPPGRRPRRSRQRPLSLPGRKRRRRSGLKRDGGNRRGAPERPRETPRRWRGPCRTAQRVARADVLAPFLTLREAPYLRNLRQTSAWPDEATSLE